MPCRRAPSRLSSPSGPSRRARESRGGALGSEGVLIEQPRFGGLPGHLPSPVRVIRVIARLNIGGPAQHAVLLTAGTKSRYPTVLVAGSIEPHEGDMSRLAERHGVTVLSISELGRSVRPFDDLLVLWKLWRVCRRLRPVIVHTHTAKAGTLGRLAGFFAGVPIRVHTFHGHVFRFYFGRLRTALFLSVERLLTRITTKIVAISPRQAEELQRYLKIPADQIAVIPLGLDLERFALADTETPRRQFRESIAAGNRIVVTLVGRLVRIKNHALAIRALAMLPPVRRQMLLVFVGGGEEEPALRTLAQQLGVADRVRFAGWREDLEAVYYGSDIVALTSDNEGTPVCLIEALACGRPVIATNVGGVADVLEDGRLGVLVPPGDAAGLAAALAAFSDEAERARYSGQGRASVRARYGIARLVAQVEALYDELLRTRCHGEPAAPSAVASAR